MNNGISKKFAVLALVLTALSNMAVQAVDKRPYALMIMGCFAMYLIVRCWEGWLDRKK